MKIKSMFFVNNEILGNLHLDFTNMNGEIVDTIIFAGENGTGKSTILRYIYEFASYDLKTIQSPEKRDFIVQLSDDDLHSIGKSSGLSQYFNNGIKTKEISFKFDFSFVSSWEQVTIEYIDNFDKRRSVPGGAFASPEGKAILRCIFSDVEINFDPGHIASVTAKDIDQAVTGSVKSTRALASEITQLLIDIQALDDADFTEWARLNRDSKIDCSKLDLRIRRFKDAFSFMFPNKEYKRVRNVNNSKKVIFEENGKEISIENLSSGEKQIVFRGGFLLKDQKSSDGAIILVDEPEISLHPTWQLKICQFLKKLVTDTQNKQSSQIFISTHSPFIIHNDSRTNDKVIILKKDNNGNIAVQPKTEFYGWTKESQVREAFNIPLSFSDLVASVFVEGETDELYLNAARHILGRRDHKYKISWIGKINAQGNAEFTGDNALNQTRHLFASNPGLLKSRVILLYDSDTKKPTEDLGMLHVRRMPINSNNTVFRKGIENLFTLNGSYDLTPFYSEKLKVDDYGAQSLLRELDKKKLCSYICNELSRDQQLAIFKNLESVFNIIDSILGEKPNSSSENLVVVQDEIPLTRHAPIS